MKKLFLGFFGATTLFFASCTKETAVIDSATTETATESAVLLASTTVVPTLNVALKEAFSTATAIQWEVAGQDLYAAKIIVNSAITYAYFQAEDGAYLMLKDANGLTVRGGKKHTKGDTIALATVPSSAVAYVTTNYPTAVIKRAYRDTISGVVQYRLSITDATTNIKTTLIFDATWTFVKAVTKTKGQNGQHTEVAIAIADISPIATAYIATNYAGYTIVSAEKATDKNGIVTYEVKISNGTTQLELIFDAAWAFVKIGKSNNGNNNHNSSHVQIALTDVPALATAYISTNYVGYTLVKAQKNTDKNGVVTYELEIKSTTKKVKLIFDNNWTFVKVG